MQSPQPATDEQKIALVERIIRGELTPEQAREKQGLSSAELKEWVRVYRREARRAFDARVKDAFSTEGMDVNDLAGAEFSGDVTELAVAELLQTIQYGRKDAEIRIEHDGVLSRIWCTDGEVVDATTGQLVGAAAVYRLLSLERGRVYADFAPVEHARTIKVSTPALLMESARRFDECRQLRQQLGDMTMVCVPSGRALAPEGLTNSTQLGVLRLLDGVRHLEEVVQVSPFADLETLTTLSQLTELQLLERVRPSRTSLEALPAASGTEFQEKSYSPFSTTLAARPAPAAALRRWAWGVATIGAASLGAAVALRFIESRQAEVQARAVVPVPVPAAAPVTAQVAFVVAPAPRCPEGTALLAAGGADPARARALKPFCMAKHEVTVEQYRQCEAEGGCEAAGRQSELPDVPLTSVARQRALSALSVQCNAGHNGRDAHPINCVTFQQAQHFCTGQGGRLPSETEWELAARGAEERDFPWGASRPDALHLNACGAECKAWFNGVGLPSLFEGLMHDQDDGHAGTAPVGSFPAGASPEGVLDLIGNVAEWTSGQVAFDDAEGDGEAGGAGAASHVVRGGAFSSGIDALSAPALRLYLSADTQARGVGFRCAFDAEAP